MKGFTLAEIVVVVLIVGVLLLAVFPMIGRFLQPAYTASSARHISALTAKLHGESVFGGVTHVLRLNLDTGEYAGYAEHSEGEFVLIPDAAGRLLEGVSFTDVVIMGEKIAGGEADIVFLPSGMVSSSIIRIADSEGEVLSIVIDGHTGRARTVEGYFEEIER